MRRAALVLLFLAAAAVASTAQIFTKLADFQWNQGIDSWGLIQGEDGNFYGTTLFGGAFNYGTVFKVTPQGAITTVYSFCAKLSCADGASPAAVLVEAGDGSFYGTTQYGGGGNINCSQGCGTIFKVTSEGVLTTLYSFDYTGGAYPQAGLMLSSDGNYYGTTSYGGRAGGWGTVFQVTPGGMLTTLHSFSQTDGAVSYAALVQATDGNFYGTTSSGGSNSEGTVFQITPAGVLATIHSFSGADGAVPLSVLVQGSDGNLYGTTYSGGYGYGTVFKVSLSGMFTTLHNFTYSEGTDGRAGLMQASDGKFYGTTEAISSAGGTIFEITYDGTLTVLHNLSYSDGGLPYAAPVQASDGKLYGTTTDGGANQLGTFYSLEVFALLSVESLGGTVTGTDGHIYCGAICSYSYPLETEVTLSAVPAPGYTFTGWTGCDNMNGSYCSVTISSKKNVIASFTPANVTLTSLTFKPSYVNGGKLSAGTLTLSVAAPPGGVTIALSSDHPGVAHPPSFVFVPGGQSSLGFAVNTFPVKSNTTVTITAAAGASQVNGTLTVGTTSLPPSLRGSN